MKKFSVITMLFLLSLIIIGSSNSVGEEPPYDLQDEIKINDDGDIDISQGSPYIAVYQNNIYITWFDNRNNTNGTSDAYFSKSTDGGGNFSANKKIGDSTGSMKIVVGPTGNIYGLSRYYSQGNITFIKSTDGGDTFSDPIYVNDEESSEPTDPEIAVDNKDNIYVVWQDYRNRPPSGTPSNPDIYLAKSSDGGESFGPNVRVNDDLSFASQSNPDIAVGENGEIYVVWTDRRSEQPGERDDENIYYTKSIDEGASFDNNIMVNNDETESTQSNPHIATDSSGIVYVVWNDERPGPGSEKSNIKVYFSKSINNGFSFEPDIFIEAGGVNAILADDNGIYIPFIFGYGQLIYSEDGENFSDSMYITPRSYMPNSRITLDEKSNIYIVWTDYQESGGYHGDIYFRKAIRVEPTNENGDNGQHNNPNQQGIDNWLWIIVALVLIASVAYIIKRKRSRKRN